MASLSRVNVQVGFQGQQAVDGFKQVEGSARKTAGEVSELAKRAEDSGNKAGSSAFGWTEFKSKIDLVGGGLKKVAGAVESFTSLGAQMQTMQTKLAYVSGSWEQAGKVLEQARQQSMETGASLESLTDGIQKLTAAGISAQGAGNILSSMAGAAELVGGGSQGIQAVAGAMGSLLQAGNATEGALQQLQDSGLSVFGSLGQELTKVTGKAYTTEEALRAIRRGAVSSAMAIQAIEAAGKTPKAIEATERFFSSFEGQMARFKATMQDAFREISKLFLEAFDWTAMTAAARGSFAAIRDIAKEISDTLLPVIDPKNKAVGIEKGFRAARDLTLDIAEGLIESAKVIVDSFKRGAKLIEDASWLANQGKRAVGLGQGALEAFAQRQIDQLNQNKPKKPPIQEEFGETARNMLKNIRERAAARDAEQAKKMELGNIFNFGGVWDSLKNGAMAMADRVKAAAQKLEIANVTFEKMALDLEENFATPAEKFNKVMQDVGGQLNDARTRLAAGNMLDRIQAGLKRKAGGQLLELMKENSIGTSWQASRAEKGSAAAMESIMRNRFGEQGKDVQERIKGALEIANRLARAPLDAQERAIQAFQNAKPGVLAFK